MPDYWGVGCEQYREAMSAGLDGEDTPAERAAAEAHRDGCPECQAWWQAAAAVTRMARTGPVTTGPAMSEAVLYAAPGRGRARLANGLRFLLGAVGASQLGLGLVQATGFAIGTVLHDGHILGGTAADHLWHESAAWNIAVGAGFLWIALRRSRPTGLLPTLTAFVGALVLLSANDVIAGRVDTGRLLSHALIIAGYTIVLALTRPAFDFGDPPSRPVDSPRWRARFDTDEPAAAAPPVSTQPIPGVAHQRRAA